MTILELIEQGKTDEEIVAQLQPSGITNYQIPLEELRWYLRDQGLLYRGIDVPFVGPLAVIATSPETPEQLRNGLVDLITHVFGTDKTLNTTDPEIAARGILMFNGLQSAGIIDQTQRDGFYSLGGGLAFENLTVEAVAEVRRHHDITTRIVAAYDAAIAARDNGEPLVMVEAALLAGWEGT